MQDAGMNHKGTDHVAQDAARRLVRGECGDIQTAITLAMDSVRFTVSALPSRALVRKHVQALSMQMQGKAAYDATVLSMLQTMEQVMGTLEHTLDDAQTWLVGRAVSGHIDADPAPHLRIQTATPPHGIADVLQMHGYGEIEITTLEARGRRFDQLHFEEDGWLITLTRLPQGQPVEPNVNLVTGRRIETLTLDQLQARIASRAGE
jgi:hypothetical protein